MIQKPAGYDTATAYTGEFETLALGGHVCIIKGARVENDRNGNPWLVLAFDIAQGDPQAGFYSRRHADLKKDNASAKWPTGGTYRQGLGEKSAAYLKGMVTCIQDSNPGYVWDWDEAKLVGKKFGGVFGEEEYKNQSGEIKTAIKCRFIRSVETIKKGVDVPEVRKYKEPNGSTGSYSNGYTAPNTGKHIPQDMIEVEEDLPFN